MHVTTIYLLTNAIPLKSLRWKHINVFASHRMICDKFDDDEGKIAFRSIHQLIVVIWRKDNRSLELVFRCVSVLFFLRKIKICILLLCCCFFGCKKVSLQIYRIVDEHISWLDIISCSASTSVIYANVYGNGR